MPTQIYGTEWKQIIIDLNLNDGTLIFSKLQIEVTHFFTQSFLPEWLQKVNHCTKSLKTKGDWAQHPLPSAKSCSGVVGEWCKEPLVNEKVSEPRNDRMVRCHTHGKTTGCPIKITELICLSAECSLGFYKGGGRNYLNEELPENLIGGGPSGYLILIIFQNKHE